MVRFRHIPKEEPRRSQRSLQPELLRELTPPHPTRARASGGSAPGLDRGALLWSCGAWFGRQTRGSSSRVERSLELPLSWGRDVGSRQGQGGLSPKTCHSGAEFRRKEGGHW